VFVGKSLNRCSGAIVWKCELVAEDGEAGGAVKWDPEGRVHLTANGCMSFIAAGVHLVEETSTMQLGYFKVAKGNQKGEASENAFQTG
jgi:hypothetical protein